MAALYLLVVEESRPDLEVSDNTEVGLLGVNGILDGVALDLDDGVAGTGGMMGGGKVTMTDSSSAVGGDGSSLRWRRWDAVTRKFLLEVVELWEVEPKLLARDGARDRVPAALTFFFGFQSIFNHVVRLESPGAKPVVMSLSTIELEDAAVVMSCGALVLRPFPIHLTPMPCTHLFNLPIDLLHSAPLLGRRFRLTLA